MSLFVDTSAFYAALDRDDRHNTRAKEILAERGQLTTTDHVLVETWRLTRALLGYSAAEQFWSGLRVGAVTIEHILPGDLDVAWRIGQAFPDQDFSIVDRTSFAVMERLAIAKVATFDDHFAIYRFGPHRDRAFELQR